MITSFFNGAEIVLAMAPKDAEQLEQTTDAIMAADETTPEIIRTVHGRLVIALREYDDHQKRERGEEAGDAPASEQPATS